MTSTEPLAETSDVADLWRPLSDAETTRVARLIVKATAQLRQNCPFDIDERIELYTTDPTAPIALDPTLVADVVATVVKRFLVNVDGVASSSEGVGPYSRSATFVNRYDKSGSDVRGALQVTESDIDRLRPAVPAPAPFAFRVGVPEPQLLIQRGARGTGTFGSPIGPVVVPDFAPGTGVE
jgi:hypothetical protein